MQPIRPVSFGPSAYGLLADLLSDVVARLGQTERTAEAAATMIAADDWLEVPVSDA